MSDIHDRIRQAEAASPHVEYTAQVIRPASDTPCPHEERYRFIRSHVVGARRARLDQDYAIWTSVREHVGSIQSILAQFATVSPFKRRLSLLMRPPAGWRVCSTCNGSGDGDIGYCRQCGGDGYTV